MPTHRAAWPPAKHCKLEVKFAQYTHPQEHEIVVANHAVGINPIDWAKQAIGDMMYLTEFSAGDRLHDWYQSGREKSGVPAYWRSLRLGKAVLSGLRTKALTLWPSFRASETKCRPVRPVAPNTKNRYIEFIDSPIA
jgi:hypothetical protein